MSVNPGTYNFTLQRRADFSLEIQFKEGDPATVIDLTGATVLSQAWNEKGLRSTLTLRAGTTIGHRARSPCP